MCAVDSKTEKIASLESTIKEQIEHIDNLRCDNAQLKQKLCKNAEDLTKASTTYRESDFELSKLKSQLKSVTKSRDLAVDENRKLQCELATLNCEVKTLRQELEQARKEAEELRMQSKQYIYEVRKVEELLASKENERERVLEQFQLLNREANNLESSNHALENEASRNKVQLTVALDHVGDLEKRCHELERLLGDYEDKISDLTTQNARLERKITDYQRDEACSKDEMKTMKELCMKLDREKEQLLALQSGRTGVTNTATERLKFEQEHLERELMEMESKMSNAEKLLAETRQELCSAKIENDEIHEENVKLNAKIRELEEKLAVAMSDATNYSEKCAEYSNQIRELRRKLTNERYLRSSGGTRYPSL